MKQNASRIAYHEAGHAVIGVCLGVPFEAVSMKEKRSKGVKLENGQRVPFYYFEGLIRSQEQHDIINGDVYAGKLDLRQAIVATAGPLAEMKFLGIADREAILAFNFDTHGISACCKFAVAPSGQIEKLPKSIMEEHVFQALRLQTDMLLQKKWMSIKAVANELLKQKCLSYSEITKIIEG